MNKIVLIFLIFFAACGGKSKNNSQTKNNEQTEIQQKYIKDSISNFERNEQLSLLGKKMNIQYMWDTIYHRYTYEYQPILETKKQLLRDFDIFDIYYKDSILYIYLHTSNYSPIFNFELSISSENLNLLKKLQSDTLNPDFVFIVSIEKLKKYRLKLETDIDDAQTENESVSIDFDYSDDFIGKGEINEIITLK